MRLNRPRPGTASALHKVSRIARLISLVWAGAFASALSSLGAVQLDLARLGTATQTGDLSAANAPARALDGNAGTFSATTEIPNAHWECQLSRDYTLTRIEIVAPSDVSYRDALDGLVLRLQDLRDRTVFETLVDDPGPGSTWAADLPAGLSARLLRIGLENGQPNGAGKHQVALAEVRAFGDPSVAAGPIALGAIATAQQSSDSSSSYPASLAIDGDPATFSQTADLTNSFWIITLDRTRPIHRIEVVNRRDTAAARLAGLVVRVLDDQSHTVASATLTNPGLGGVWGFNCPANTSGRHVRIGLEAGAANGAGDRIVSLAEVIVLTAPNLALGRDCYMVRYQDNLPPASNANDGNYATGIETTDKSVDAYWEVDLGMPNALYSVRAVAAQGFAARLSHATVRLFDANHDSVFSQHLAGTNPTFDVDVAGPITARYVRVGFENKERSDSTGGIEWYLGLREVQVFGRPAHEIGLLAFSASANSIASGDSTTLTWQAEELHRLDLYPGGQSVGAFTDNGGAGQLTVSPATSVEYLLVGTNRNGASVRASSVIVDDRLLPVRINEFVADNRLSLEDGRGEPSDWIELYNPNNQPRDLAGYGLSDDPAAPMKWVFPSASIPAHGCLVVFASGRNAPWDEAGGLHANFQLDAEGESVLLTAPDGASVVDVISAFPPQREDLAYGRTLDGRLAFLDPTPGGPNLAASYDGWLQPPAFSHARGFHTNAFALTITDPNQGAELLYSIDGREPALRYGGPLAVSSSLSVRATVRRPGCKPPRTVTHSYVLVDGVMAAASMNQNMVRDVRYTDRIRRGLAGLPTLMIAVPQIPDDYIEREASVELLWPNQTPHVQANCGFFRFGGAWTTFNKKNYRLKFRGEYGATKLRAPLFRGMDRGFLARESFDEIDLVGGSHDMIDRGFYMAGRFTEDTMLDMGSLNPHGRFVNVYLNGKYWGQYHARERLTDSFLADYLGGEREDYANVRGNDNVGDSFIPGTPDPRNRAPWENLRANRSSYVASKPYLDVPHLIDFMLMWFYGDCETEYRSAGPIAPGSGFKFWIGDADGFLRTSALTSDRTSNPGPGGLFGALISEKHPDFMTLLADRIQRHFFLDGALTPARNLARLDERMLEITNSLVAECARWGVRTPENWQSAAQTIRTGLFPGRTANLFNLLRNRGLYPSLQAPQMNQWGGIVTNGFTVLFAGTGGTIYYTLDGSDPRLPGGAVAPGALVAGTGGEETLIAPGAVWRYWDKGAPPATWNTPAFNAQSWNTGRSELGYGDGDEATVLEFGPDPNNKYPTCYFRHAFTVSDPAAITELVVELLRDDGAIVYLNGKELLRDNMPAGLVQYTDFASTAVGGASESQFYNFPLAPTGLMAGTNLLAVEVHQSGANSTDVSFNLALRARSTTAATGIVIDDNALIRARALSGTTWSALVEARFDIAQAQPLAPGQIVISEIHYNPAGSPDCEFIELWNICSNLVDLTGARLAGGVDFLFPSGFRIPPGGFALVVEDTAAFAARYQSPDSLYYHPDLAVAGAWAGRLDNSGEAVALLTPKLDAVCSVAYWPDGSWPRRADGQGSSIELRDPTSVPTNAPAQMDYLAQGRHWRPSPLYHGSPGRLDAWVPPVVLSESWAGGDRITDWIELHNPGAEPFDLRGLYLSDQYDQPFRHAFEQELHVPAGGRLVLSAAQFGFGLSTRGSDILLVSASGTNIVRFVDTVEFPTVDRDETCGRYERSDGMTDYTELRAATPGEANALPRVGPVVFSEIMYHPAPGLAEYVELVNISDAAVDLCDPAVPTNVWELAGAVRFSFPPGQSLPPCTPLIVCNTNPAAFRTQYAVSDEVPVLGPWAGLLDNAGENLRLVRPGPPGTDGAVPFYRVDRVEYEPRTPWPLVPDTGGASLERVMLEGYGNDPANWITSTSGGTPGRLQANRPPILIRCVFDPAEAIPRFFIEGCPGATCEIQYTDTLAPSVWRLLKTIQEAGPDPIEFRDPEFPLPHHRFYRVVVCRPVGRVP